MAVARRSKDPMDEPPPPPPEPKEGEALEVDVSEDPEDEEEPEAQPQPEADPGVRQQKRRERGKLRAELDELRQQREQDRQEYQRRLDEAYRLVQQTSQRQHPTQQQTDPEDAELEQVQQQNTLLLQAWQALKEPTEAQRTDFMRRAQELRNRETAVHVRKQLRSVVPSQEQQQMHAQQQFINARYPDVMSNDRARAWVDAEYRKRVVEGKPHHVDTLDEVMNDARRQWKIGPRQADASLTRKLQGMPSSGGGGGARSKSTVTLSPLEQRMADRMYPMIKDDAERYRTFAKEIKGPEAEE